MARVLYVEDDAFLRNIFKNSCEGTEIELLTAADAEEGMNVLKSEKIDLVLLDLLLPGEHGFEFLEKKKNIEAVQGIPVIVFSNLDSEEDKEKALSLGATEYHLKVMKQPKAVLRQVIALLKEKGIT